jgi:hypothetical protein
MHLFGIVVSDSSQLRAFLGTVFRDVYDRTFRTFEAANLPTIQETTSTTKSVMSILYSDSII